jgi:two-component sensor histidine kinase
MISETDLDAILDALPDLAFIVTQDGVIERSNRHAREFVPAASPRGNLYSATDDAEGLRRLLARASGTDQACIGSISLPKPGHSARFRVVAQLLARPEKGRLSRLFLRCTDVADARFSVLTRRIEELNGEIRKRRHLQAVLEESLRERELLVREIHHRVKNNVQMLSSMLRFSERETASPEAKMVLADAARRVASVAVIQQVLYQSETLHATSASALINTLVRHIRDSLPPGTQIETEVGTFALTTEFVLPLTLIINELVTNGVKHGLRADPNGHVTITFRHENGEYELCVHSPGRGFELAETGRRSSGLGLIRGLVRQLRGNFEVTAEEDVTCKVRFRGKADGTY